MPRRKAEDVPEEPSPRKRRGGRASGAGSSESSPEANLFRLEEAQFEPPETPDAPTRAGAELEEEFEPQPPEPLEWTPERAATIVKGAGLLLHTADSLADEPGGEELWRATVADCENMGPPLARILNRYNAARRLAGLSDEGELAFGVIAYAKRNMIVRGRLRQAKKARLEAEAAGQPGPLFEPEPPPAPA